MTVNRSKKILPDLYGYLKFLKVPLTTDTLVVAKKVFIEELRDLLGEAVRMTHYGNLTSGSNMFKSCKNVVLYGRLEPKLQQKNALSDLGKETQSIEEIGLREELQALGRIRFFDDPSKKLYVFTNTAKENIIERIADKDKLHVFRERELKIALYTLSKESELTGLSKSEVYDALENSHNTIRPAFKKLLIPLGYCNNLYGKNKQRYLKWM
jgi:hypothetical protein